MAKRTKKRKAIRTLSTGTKVDITIGLLESLSGQLAKLVDVVARLDDKMEVVTEAALAPPTIVDTSATSASNLALNCGGLISVSAKNSLIASELCQIDGQLHNWSYPWNGMESPFCTKCKQLPKAANCGAV